MIHFETKTQVVPALSSTHAEIVAMSSALRRVAFIEDFLRELSMLCQVVIYEDNQSTMSNFNSLHINDSNKHIRIKHWSNKFLFAQPHYSLRRVSTKFQIADIGTRPHDGANFLRLRKLMDEFSPGLDYSKMS